MALSDELRDPWGLLVAGVSGGMAWALLAAATAPAALPVGVAVGAAVLGVKAASGVLLNRGEGEPRRSPALARPPAGSVAAGWLQRAEAAVRALDDLAGTARRGSLSVSIGAAVQEAGDTLTALARLGAQATAVESALARVDDPGLDTEAARLAEAARRSAPPGVQQEVARSAAAVADRLAVRDRLRGARAQLLARMQAVALGLEGLVARLAEVLALAETTGGLEDTAGEVADLAVELEGLRAGLEETEAVSRGALAAAPLPPAHDG